MTMNLHLTDADSASINHVVLSWSGLLGKFRELFPGNEEGITSTAQVEAMEAAGCSFRKMVCDKRVPADLLRFLYRSSDWYVRGAVAYVDFPEILVILAGDANKYVRIPVASNRNTPPEVLVRLSEDPDPVVARSARRNSRHPANAV